MSSTPSNLLANLQCGADKQVWSALAEIGKQLQILAGAHTGQTTSFFQTPRVISTLTVGELVREFLFAKARAGRSDRYLAALRYSLTSFSKGRNCTSIGDVTVSDIEGWLNESGIKARTMRGYLGDVSTMFNFAVRRGYIDRNPARGVELPSCEPATAALHDPATVKIVLEFAKEYDLNICRALAIRYFCGLRTAEIERVDESAIKENHIEVAALAAKTRRRRLVTIQPNLREWLALGGELPAPPTNGRRMLEFMRALALKGVAWPHNVTRHSFCSYHLAKFQNAGKTALEAGHTEQMLFAHYREIVTESQAAEFWEIRPKT